MLNRLAGGVNWQVPTFGSTGTSGLRPFDNGGGSAWSIAGGRVHVRRAGRCTRTPFPNNVIPAERIVDLLSRARSS